MRIQVSLLVTRSWWFFFILLNLFTYYLYLDFNIHMIIYAILLLLLLIAVTLRRDMTILFSRITIIISLYCSILAVSSVYLKYLDKGIGIYGGLFHSTSNTQIFQIFIFMICTVILQLTAFYPRKV